MKLKEIRLNPEPCLTGAGTADNQHILIPRIGGILWSVAHHEPLCLGEKHIVFKNRIHEWRNVIRAAPAGRTVFRIAPVFLCIFAFQMNGKLKTNTTD